MTTFIVVVMFPLHILFGVWLGWYLWGTDAKFWRLREVHYRNLWLKEMGYEDLVEEETT